MRKFRAFFKVRWKFVSSCGKRSESKLRFRFFVQKAIYSYFLFLIPLPFSASISISISFSVSVSASASVARARSALNRTHRPILSRRSASLSFAAALTILPTIRQSQIVHVAPAPAPPPVRTRRRESARFDIIFEENAEKTQKTEKYCEKSRKYGNLRGEYTTRKNLKNVKVAARKISRGV